MTRLAARALAALAAVLLLVLGAATPASAHVVPSSAVVLDVGQDRVDASLRIPVDDLEAASGIDLGSGSAAALEAASARVRAYLAQHIRPTSDGTTWTTTIDALSIGSSEQLGTGTYRVLHAVATLTPASGTVPRSFALGYTVVVHTVVTHVAIVSVRRDWASGATSGAREVGTVEVDTVTGRVDDLQVRLGAGSTWQGFVSMVALGARHIAEGTDHQLFLLTLLLPAPLLTARRRWGGAAPPRRALRRIGGITLAFTVGHSATLALSAVGGLRIPQQPVEALIAVSILVAAVHAVRPLFSGREPLIAGLFGLVHGMAFAATLSELDLTGSRLALSLLGFNLGIELMQLAIVAVVLPPLCMLARTSGYRPLRVLGAVVVAVAAGGWLAARLGVDNPVAALADGLGGASIWILVALWIAAAAVGPFRRRARAGAAARSTDGTARPAAEVATAAGVR